MTLTEFLTARLDEDETEARKAIAERMRVQYVDPENATRPDFDLVSWPDLGVPAMLIGPERVLAEVEAKRRIVEMHADAYGHNRDTMWGQSVRTGVTFALAHLAAVYSDHPDYRDEWRP